MKRQMILDHLQLAERHVVEGERHLARQRDIVDTLEREGLDGKTARALLVQFEEMQTLHLADRDRLRAELAAQNDGD